MRGVELRGPAAIRSDRCRRAALGCKGKKKMSLNVFPDERQIGFKTGDDHRSAPSHLTCPILTPECADVIEALRQLIEIFRAEK